MKVRNLYVLLTADGDGGISSFFTLDTALVERLRKAGNANLISAETFCNYGMCPVNGFQVDTIELHPYTDVSNLGVTMLNSDDVNSMLDEAGAETVEVDPLDSYATRPISQIGDMMSLSEWREGCEDLMFTTDDGHGYYATANQMITSLSCFDTLPRDLFDIIDRVVWFNK